MNFKLIKYSEEQQSDFAKPSYHYLPIGYIQYNDGRTKELKELTEEEFVELFREEIEIQTKNRTRYLNVDIFKENCEQLKIIQNALTVWIKENCNPYNEMSPSLLARILSESIHNKQGVQTLKYTLGLSLKQTPNKKWVITKSLFGKKTLADAHNEIKKLKLEKNNLTDVTVDEIIKHLEKQAEKNQHPEEESPTT